MLRFISVLLCVFFETKRPNSLRGRSDVFLRLRELNINSLGLFRFDFLLMLRKGLQERNLADYRLYS